jgi:phage transcriptional regulator, rinA family|nr:MAG TPA: transcriptional activator [Bacteriophage sp.]DAR64322.1 MAG TPA: transcriptional activator [Caudoviricetes sp.]DAT25489.1 MAG TPA: transcriptional activator [Caudoviricetes sp.]
MDKSELAYFEKLFKEYYSYDKKILLRKAELTVREIDENVGGGKSNIRAKTVENMVIKQLSDERLVFLENVKDAIEYTLDMIEMINPHFKTLIVEKYFKNGGIETWEDVAKRVGWSTSQAYNIRYKTLEIFANKLGLANTL